MEVVGLGTLKAIHLDYVKSSVCLGFQATSRLPSMRGFRILPKIMSYGVLA